MIREILPGLFQIRSFLVSSYLLVDGDQVYLIDGGFLGGLSLIEEALNGLGMSWKNVEAVLMTHGHLDHTLNLAEIVRLSGCRVYAHSADGDHFQGRHLYRGFSRICGLLEMAGRGILGFTPRKPDSQILDGELLPFWDGLRVVHLPGHTAGHCGFYSTERNLLFSGDLFETYRFRTASPWAFLNTMPNEMEGSLKKVRDLAPVGILSNHCDYASPQEQWSRFSKHLL